MEPQNTTPVMQNMVALVESPHDLLLKLVQASLRMSGSFVLLCTLEGIPKGPLFWTIMVLDLALTAWALVPVYMVGRFVMRTNQIDDPKPIPDIKKLIIFNLMLLPAVPGLIPIPLTTFIPDITHTLRSALEPAIAMALSAAVLEFGRVVILPRYYGSQKELIIE